MGKRRTQKATHAEGEHGPKTEARNIEQLESSPSRPSVEARIARARSKGAHEGKRRLVEDREQHDEADKNSEHERAVDQARGHRRTKGRSQ